MSPWARCSSRRWGTAKCRARCEGRGMREYTGPVELIREVIFVPGDPPRLAAATGAALVVWELNAPAAPLAVVEFKNPGRSPLLTAAADGSWLAAGSTETLEVSAWPPGP